MIESIKSNKTVDNSEEYKEFESPINMQEYLPFVIDSISFSGASTSGVYFLVNICRYYDNTVDAFLVLQLSNVDPEFLILPQMPHTRLIQRQVNNECICFDIAGLRLKSLIPLRQWRIEYNGIMKGYKNPKSIFAVELDVTWTDWSGIITTVEDASFPRTLAMLNVVEPKNVFGKKDWQIEYHQVGEILGKVTVNGAVYDLCFKSLRERLVSNATYNMYCYRYAVHLVSLQNGDFLYIINYQLYDSDTTLAKGYIFRKILGETFKIDYCDLDLCTFGVKGVPPNDYVFTFRTVTDVPTRVAVYVLDSSELFIGAKWECRIVIRTCHFLIRGVNGYGISGWMYPNPLGREYPVAAPLIDPRDVVVLLEAPEVRMDLPPTTTFG